MDKYNAPEGGISQAGRRKASPETRGSIHEEKVAQADGTQRARRRKASDIFGQVQTRLNYGLASPGYRMQWIHEEEIQQYVQADDYDHILNPDGTHVTHQTGMRPNGQPVYMYAVQKLEEFVKDDERARDEIRKQHEDFSHKPKNVVGVTMTGDAEENARTYIPADVPLKGERRTEVVKE